MKKLSQFFGKKIRKHFSNLEKMKMGKNVSEI